MGNSRDKKLYDKTKHTITGWFNIHYKGMSQRERKHFDRDLSFDRWEFEKWILDNNFEKFSELFSNWIKSEFNTDLCPSIDRIDPYKGYTFDNMQLLTWKENNIKGHNEKKNSSVEQMLKSTRKRVQKFLLDGKFIEEYISLSEAARQNNISSACICECCKGKRKSAKGFRWKYV